MSKIQQNYQIAKELYAAYGVDCDRAIALARSTPISVHCWQIDDLAGFESPDVVLSNGLAATGNAPGKPKGEQEYMQHLNSALDLIPGQTKLALHAIYLKAGGKRVDRDAIEPAHFAGWVDYAKERKIGLDFNPTYISHPLADDGWTLASADERVRKFWVEHGKRSREIGAYFGRELGRQCVTNHWIPDGYKDTTADKLAPRLRLIESLDEILQEPIDRKYNVDSLESKLFGIGSESYVVGSHEFYTNYVMNRKNSIVCMDIGHFHPTEVVSSKLSAYLCFGQELMLHVSRPVRWDSDHVVALDDELKALMGEIVRADALERVHIGLDFFDASINRIAATVIGARNARKALLYALLEPYRQMIEAEAQGDLTKRLVLQEESKLLPFGLVWDMLCELENMPAENWFDRVER